MSQAQAERGARIPSLDGLRAISVALVVLAHLLHTGAIPFAQGRWASFVGEKCGELGVKVFFVISGFLITSLLRKEIEATGRVSLADFFLRRAFRIFPAYYAYLAIVAIAARIGWIELLPGDLLHALTYTTNYHFERANVVAHTWSLAVEEQFYLLWPLAMGLAGPRRRTRVVAAVLLLAPMARFASWVVQTKIGSHNVGIGQTFPTVMDAIGVGCLLALERERIAAFRPYDALLRSRWFPLVPLAVPPILAGTYLLAFNHTVAQTLLNVVIAICIDRATRLSGGPVIALLNARPLVWVGTLSYSIYLWQQPFCDSEVRAPWSSLPLCLALTAACAAASYYAIEKPCLRLRARLESRAKSRANSRR